MTTFDAGADAVDVNSSIIWGYVIGQDQQNYQWYDITYSDVQGGYPGEGNISLPPGFVSSDDFHLNRLSPCIDRGTDTGVYEDYDGNVRPQGDGYDMGAYESIPGAGWGVPEAQAAALYGTPKEVKDTSRINSLIALFLIPMGAVILLRILSRKG